MIANEIVWQTHQVQKWFPVCFAFLPIRVLLLKNYVSLCVCLSVFRSFFSLNIYIVGFIIVHSILIVIQLNAFPFAFAEICGFFAFHLPSTYSLSYSFIILLFDKVHNTNGKCDYFVVCETHLAQIKCCIHKNGFICTRISLFVLLILFLSSKHSLLSVFFKPWRFEISFLAFQ